MCNSKFAAMCRFNPIENSATLTASFAKRAGMVGTAEYNYLVSLRKSNPGLVVLKATHASPTPKTDEEGKVKPRDPFAKVSYKAMEDYMSQCRTKDAYQKEFNNIRLLSKGQPVPYQYVRQWFKKKFPLFGSIDVQYDAEGFIVERIEEKVKATVEQEVVRPATKPSKPEIVEELPLVA